jgi:hypothetical protein
MEENVRLHSRIGAKIVAAVKIQEYIARILIEVSVRVS